MKPSKRNLANAAAKVRTAKTPPVSKYALKRYGQAATVQTLADKYRKKAEQ